MKTIKLLFFIIVIVSLATCSKKKVDMPLRYIETGVTERINAIYFLNETNGFAVGGSRYNEGYILKTIDGGTTWRKLTENEIIANNGESLQTLYGIDFYNENIGQIVGFGGRVLRTENGGKTWVVILNGTYETFSSVSMQGEQMAYIGTSTSTSEGAIFSSDEFWYFFKRDTFPFPLRDIHFVDENIAFAAGNGSIQKSIDGGKTWNYSDIKGDYFFDIDFPTPNIGFACGWDGGVYKTVNQGESWKKKDLKNQILSSRQHYESLDFITEQIGAVCGYRGQVILTKNGGDTWEIIKTETNDNFHSIKFLNENLLFVGGENGVLLEISVP